LLKQGNLIEASKRGIRHFSISNIERFGKKIEPSHPALIKFHWLEQFFPAVGQNNFRNKIPFFSKTRIHF
jgi:hypothetical protein